MTYLASGFQDVDGTHAIEQFTHCLNVLASLEFFQNYKQKTFELLHLDAGAAVLEVGCGIGKDAIALAQRVGSHGKVVAIDHSQAMLDLALESIKGLNLPIEFVHTEAQQLPFEDNTFQGARVDRTLQHISEPQRAIAEMARVVCPGGYVVAMEPDWETFTVDSENHPLTRQLLNFWCDSFPTGWVGRDLLKLFHRIGLTDIQVIPETLVVTQFELANQVFDLVQTTYRACEAGIVSRVEVEAWLHELQQMDQSQEFFSSFTGFIISGKKQ
ncbi:MAG: class I SAM-dependent methyltransferase [Chroococcidiopsidaceae cyanobacterium CP_BM_ER_R8_30]|nr:class I SAM-dependent methyltransferase [Chroococcidiopsidaceae cyanobacterium CP_BM_ER_R8_30]